jgi:CMP-N-acetylneuraminic acid synthetase
MLAFVPARGCSKGIPKKNMVDLNGKPLIQYTLDILNKLGDIIYPFISTDDEKISSYCASKGFDMAYRRPTELAEDDSLIIDAIWHALDWLEENRNYGCESVLLLQPTTPIRNSDEIKCAIEKFNTDSLESLTSVTPMREHPYECVEIHGGKWDFLREPLHDVKGRQSYNQDYFFIDGSFYLGTVSFLKANNGFLKKSVTYLFKLDRIWPVDIDHPDDICVAETFLDKK